MVGFERMYNDQWMLEEFDYRSQARTRHDLVGLDKTAPRSCFPQRA